MIRWVGLGALFLGVLLYITLSLAPDGPPRDAPHDSAAATRACQDEVRSRMEAVDFSLSPEIEYRDAGRYAISGVVDGRMSGTEARRNYDCAVQYLSSGTYLVDSVTVWQSH